MGISTSWGGRLAGSWFPAVKQLIMLSYFDLRIQVRYPIKMRFGATADAISQAMGKFPGKDG